MSEPVKLSPVGHALPSTSGAHAAPHAAVRGRGAAAHPLAPGHRRPGRVALVTGASSGIGRAIADELRQHGYWVFAASRHVGCWLHHDVAPAHVIPLTMDVTCGDSVACGIEQLMARAGRLDVVVNAAGFGIAGPFEETPIEAAASQMDTNFYGTARVCRAVVPILRQQGAGAIMNVSSIGGRLGLPFQAYYAASKFAIEGLTESLHYELAPFGVRVMLLEPGNTRTSFTDRRQSHGGAGHSPYRDAFARVLDVVHRDEQEGASPQQLALTARRLLERRAPPLRRADGPWLETLGLWLSRFLPRALFDVGFRRVMGL